MPFSSPFNAEQARALIEGGVDRAHRDAHRHAQPQDVAVREELFVADVRRVPLPRPDHAAKATLFALLDNNAHHHVTLTEPFAMHPASVSGLYFAHPARATSPPSAGDHGTAHLSSHR